MVKEDATDEEIIEALKVSCAWDFVEKLPDPSTVIWASGDGDFPKDRPRGSRLQERC